MWCIEIARQSTFRDIIKVKHNFTMLFTFGGIIGCISLLAIPFLRFSRKHTCKVLFYSMNRQIMVRRIDKFRIFIFGTVLVNQNNHSWLILQKTFVTYLWMYIAINIDEWTRSELFIHRPLKCVHSFCINTNPTLQHDSDVETQVLKTASGNIWSSLGMFYLSLHRNYEYPNE